MKLTPEMKETKKKRKREEIRKELVWEVLKEFIQEKEDKKAMVEAARRATEEKYRRENPPGNGN
jgi:threonine synthase